MPTLQDIFVVLSFNIKGLEISSTIFLLIVSTCL